MIRRTIVLSLLIALLAPAAAAAQAQNPFGPLPPAQPTPAPTPAQQDDPFSDDIGRDTLYVIGGALLLVFIAVGVIITRDARKSLPRTARDSRRLREEGPHKHERKAKAKARARGKAQKAARRRNRRY